MRPTVWTYSLVMAVPAAGPGTSAAVFGCACALVNASAPMSAAARRSFVWGAFMGEFLLFQILDRRPADAAVEGERRLAEVVERHGETEVYTDIEGFAGGE